MQIPSNNSIQVTSKHFVDKLENNIIQVARAISIEHQVKVDPDAKKITREIIQRKINHLLSDDEREGIRKLWKNTVDNLQITTGDGIQYARMVYEALKTAGFNDV